MGWKLSRTIAALGLCGSLLTTAAAAQQGGASYWLGVGITAPVSDFHADALGRGYNVGWEGQASVRFNPGRSVASILLSATYGQNPANDQLKASLTTANGGRPTEATAKLFGGTADLTYEFRSSSPAKAYILAGIGLYDFKVSVTSGTTSADTSKTKLTWNAGLGVTYRLRGAELFAEARYMDIVIASPVGGLFSGSDIKFFPILAGVRFGGT